MYESIEDHGIVESEGQDLEYVEAVLEGRVATTGRFGGDVTTLPSSTSHSRRRQSGGRRGGRARERRQQYSRRAGRQGARDRHSHHQRQRPHAGSRMPTYDVEIITGADMILDSADLKAFETIVKTQCLMMYGDGMVYRRCLDIFRSMNLAEGMRQVLEYLAERREMEVSNQSLLYTKDSTEIASLSWLLLMHALPSQMRFELQKGQELPSVGDIGAWMVSVALFLQALKESQDDCIEYVDVVICCDHLPDRSADVVLQGIEHISIAVKQLSIARDRTLRISFSLKNLADLDSSSQLKRGFDQFQQGLVDAVELYNPNLLGTRQKAAFLMGTHPRLGSMSPLCLLNRDIIEQIFKTIEKERLYIEFLH